MKERERDITGGDHSRTMILRVEFGRYWRAWSWVRRQFSAVSIGTIAALVLTGGGWLLSLKTRVVVLETQIVPDLRQAERVATLEQHDSNHEGRITSLERDYAVAAEHAGDAPTVTSRKRK